MNVSLAPELEMLGTRKVESETQWKNFTKTARNAAPLPGKQPGATFASAMRGCLWFVDLPIQFQADSRWRDILELTLLSRGHNCFMALSRAA
jgi:hypothetical protein